MFPRIWAATSRISVSAKSRLMSPAPPGGAVREVARGSTAPYPNCAGGDAPGAPTVPLTRGGAVAPPLIKGFSGAIAGSDGAWQPAKAKKLHKSAAQWDGRRGGGLSGTMGKHLCP